MIETANIAGAGLGGLLAALTLSRVGATVRIFEKAETLGEVGAGIQLSPNAMHVARDLGVEAQIIAAGFEPKAAVIRHSITGKRYVDAPLAAACNERYGAPYIHIHRADLHAILLKAALDAGATVDTGVAVKTYETDDQSTRLHLSDGRVSEADLLIGADGLRSKVRETMLGAEDPDFTGQVAWRGVVPTTALPPGLIDPDATVWVGENRHLVTYYLRGGELVNFVAVEERNDWREESWTQPGDLNELRAAFGDWHPVVATLIGKVEQPFLWALFDRKPLPRWTDGRVALLGDACHPMLPFMAQGAAMAFEDAHTLASCVAGNDDTSEALRWYEALRKPRTSTIQTRARENAAMFHLDGVSARIRLAIASLLPARAAFWSLDSIYGFDPTKVSIPTRSSKPD